jgi:hypothetical protein
VDIKSEPKFTEIQVTDLDIAFPGELQTYTVKDGQDHLTREGNTLTLAFAAGGEVVFHLEHALWYAKRHRTIRVPVVETDTGD